MATVHGVETNEASRYCIGNPTRNNQSHLIFTVFSHRFIDHTLATPWETLVSDLESALRTMLKTGQSEAKVDIYYQGLTYKLEKRKALQKKENKTHSKSEISRDFTWLQTTYNINWFILFSQSVQSNDYNTSYRTTLLSAFVTAVKNAGSFGHLSLPVFFTYSYVTDISKSTDLIGYQVLLSAHGILKTEGGSNSSPVVRWCRYEAHGCTQSHMKPQFAFYDGLRRIFQNQLCALRLASKNAETFYIETDVSFRHQQSTMYGLLGGDAVTSNTNTRSVSFPIATPFSVNFIKRLTALVPADEVNATILTDLCFDLTYRAQPQNSIIDNANFTTFVPSKLPPHCWSVYSEFKTAHFNVGESGILPSAHKAYLSGFNHFGTEYALSSTWMCHCVRKLLAFYLLSVYCGKRKINIETMSADIEATENLLDKNTLDRIEEVLSEETKQVFYAVCRQQVDSKLSPAVSASTSATVAPLTPPPGNKLSSYDYSTSIKGKSALKEALVPPSAGDKSPSKGSRKGSPVPTPVSSVTSTIAPGTLGNVAANLFGGEGDDWNLRCDRHRAVVDNLFSPESIYALEDLDEAAVRNLSLDVHTSSSVGLWMAMFSVLCASASVDALDMATIWSKCMRKMHIAWEDGQLLPAFTPPAASAFHTTAGTTSASAISTRSSRASGDTSGRAPLLAFGAASRADQNMPICLRTLWGDAIDRRQEEELHSAPRSRNQLHLAWPDQSESLVLQKLQQLQFCIAMQNESAVYQFAEETVSVEVAAAIPPISSNQPEDDTPKEGRAEEGISAPAASVSPALAATTTTVIITQPNLFRRLPLTEDTITMNKYLARKVSATNSRSNRAHPTLKVQLQLPSILSDMKAFKAANPKVGLLVFCQWYGVQPVAVNHTEPAATATNPLDGRDGGDGSSSGTTSPAPDAEPTADINTAVTAPATTSAVPVTAKTTTDAVAMNGFVKVSVEELSKAWECCEAAACEDQGKPLFQVEKEAEKAMAYLESVSATELASEMVISGMRLLCGILCKQLDPWVMSESPHTPVAAGEDCSSSSSSGSEAREDAASSPLPDHRSNALSSLKTTLRRDLVLLKEQVEIAVQSLQLPKIQDPTAKLMTGDVEFNIATLILVDSVAGLLQKLEALLVRMQTLGALVSTTKSADAFHQAENLIYALARKDVCTAETGSEMSVLYELAKALRNIKEQTHDWHSRDGRELGQASSKTFSCKLAQPRQQQLQASDTSTAKSHSPSPVSGGGSVNTTRPASTGAAPVITTGGVVHNSALTAASSLLDVFQMEATVQQDFLRMSFRVPEDSC